MSRSKKSGPLKKKKGKKSSWLLTRLLVNSHSTSIFQVLFWRGQCWLWGSRFFVTFFLLKLECRGYAYFTLAAGMARYTSSSVRSPIKNFPLWRDPQLLPILLV